MPKGTPKTIMQAIDHGLYDMPARSIPENLYQCVRDFLAQRFGAAMLCEPTHADALKALFEEIVKVDP